MPVRCVARAVNKAVCFTVARKFNGNVFSFLIFPVNLVNSPSEKLIQEAHSCLCAIVSARYDMVYFAYVVQVFD